MCGVGPPVLVAEALRVAQKDEFLGGAGAPECLIAVREAAEAADDREMAAGEALYAGEKRSQLGRRLFEQAQVSGDGFFLNVEPLGVLQRHVEKDTLERREGRIGAGLDARERERERRLIGGERAGCPAVGVTRKLIEQQD